MGKPEGKRPLGRLRRRWGHNIKLDVQDLGCGGLDWIELVPGNFVCGNGPSGSMKCGEFLDKLQTS